MCIAEQQALVLGEVAVQGQGKPVELAPQPPLGQVGHRGRRQPLPSASACSISMPETPNTLLITPASLMPRSPAA